MLRSQAGVDAIESAARIGGAIAIEARRSCAAERSREPRGSRRTRILDQTGSGRVLEGSLCFAVIVEAEFVDRAVADRPGVGQIVLLEAFGNDRRKAGHVGACGLELSEGQGYVVIVEVVVSAEILAVADAVVDLERELVAALGLHRRGLHRVAATLRRGN